MQNMGKSVMRVAKNSIKGYSDAQTKVRDATSNDPWGPSGTQMSEIAALTFNQNDFVEIIEMLDKRLNDKGKNWRHVFKSLTLLDYCLHAGSENTVQYFRENLYIVKTLKEFQYIDEFGKDQGANVRQKAKDITNLLLDEKRMRDQRKNREHMRDRMQGDAPPPAAARPRSNTAPSGDRDMQAAIEASKRQAEADARKNRQAQGDAELEEALRLSREEDERRQRELAGQSGSLFDDQQQNNLIDVNAGFDQQQQQPMMTGFQSYNPYAAMQQQQMQEEYMRQQQMAELQQQQQYQQMLAQQQAYAQQQQQAQEEYIRQQQYMQFQQQQQQQQIQPQPTGYGSNNPFAAFAPQQQPQQTAPPPLPQSDSYSSFNSQPAPEPAPAPVSRPTTPARSKTPKDDGKHAELARMLAAGYDSGVDSFGNVGNMRIPVGAAFAQKTGSLQAQLTGRPNPFTQQQQQQQAQQHQQQQQQNEQPFFQL